ncbi:MAG: hypothetical protein WBA42_07010 [Mesorhizobium sp.]
MALPPRVFYTIIELSVRWGCSPADIVGWAAMDQIELVTGVPLVQTESGPVSGLVTIHGADLLVMFRRYSVQTEFQIWRLRPSGSDKWQQITEPVGGFTITAQDIQIMATEVARFEDEHEMAPAGRRASSALPTFKYDWDAMYLAVIKRIHEDGLPDTQAEFVAEFQEWFMRRSETGEAPDERTIRRRLNPIWRALREAA